MFGMGTGDPLRLVTGMVKDFLSGFFLFSLPTSVSSKPNNTIITFSFSFRYSLFSFIRSSTLERFSLFGQALGLLVSVSLIHYCTYTSDLSNT